MQRNELEAYLDAYLRVSEFRDYCPNGLQVEGREDVSVIVSGVTASAALLAAAIEAGADAVLVHHGYFWRGEDARITGMRRRRIAALIAHDLNLYAFHLPLDAHPAVGNNAMIARRLGLEPLGTFGEQNIAVHGRLAAPVRLSAFAARVETNLGRAPLVLGDPQRTVQRIGWCTGAAQGYFEDAMRLGVDVYLTGEASEQTYHLAQESGVAFIGAGHHATERYGVQALGEHLAARFGLQHRYIDVPNPL